MYVVLRKHYLNIFRNDTDVQIEQLDRIILHTEPLGLDIRIYISIYR